MYLAAFLYFMLVSRGNTMLGSMMENEKVEMFYLKKVSSAEIMKIEFEDQLERLGHTFELRNINNMYGAYDLNK